ncbi:hypothetical protein GCM10020255_032120 [Rhodococcus baikonurensis]
MHQVDASADPAVVGLLGCGVMAGMGAAMNTGNVGRGDSVAVIGCGGVGDAAIMGSRLAGANTIIAIDRDPRKLEWATELGATHTINATEVDDVVEAVQELTGGFGADVVVDAVGRPETWKQAFYARDLAGTVVLVGVPTPDMKLEMPLVDFFSRGGALKSSGTAIVCPSVTSPFWSTCTSRGVCRSRSSSASASSSTRWRRHSRRCTAARSSVRWWSCDVACGSSSHFGHVQPRRRNVGRRQQHLADR